MFREWNITIERSRIEKELPTIKYHVAMEAARKSNCFPARNGTSKHCSPRIILYEEIFYFKTHCMRCAGDLAHSHEDETIKNNDSTRTLYCMHLRPSVDQQEGHNLLHLQTNKIINIKKCAPVPTNEWFIKSLHSIPEHEGIPNSLKQKTGIRLFISTRIGTQDWIITAIIKSRVKKMVKIAKKRL